MMQTETINKSRRRVERISLTIPVRVDCQESKIVSWSEITRFDSLSSFGAGFALSQKVEVGQLLLLTASFPSELRDSDYSVWTLVRYCDVIKPLGNSKEHYSVGVAFMGKYPPVNHRANLDKRYLLSGFNQDGFCEIREMGTDPDPLDSPASFKIVRQDKRHSIPFEVFVEVLDEKQKAIDYDLTITENVSRGGSALKTNLDARIGSFVRISLIGYDISILAIVRNRHIGENGISRLHLESIDQQFPLDGVE